MSFLFEALSGGSTLGEIVRSLLVSLGALFGGVVGEKWSLSSKRIGALLDGASFEEAFGDYFTGKLSERDVLLLRHVCDVVSVRATKLIAAGKLQKKHKDLCFCFYLGYPLCDPGHPFYDILHVILT